MNEEDWRGSVFQENIQFRIMRKVLFSTEQKVRDMYGKKHLISDYIQGMPLESSSDSLFVSSSEPVLKEQYISYWGQKLELDETKRERMSEIWDMEILEKNKNPEIGRTAIYFQDGRKLTEDHLLSILLETFSL